MKKVLKIAGYALVALLVAVAAGVVYMQYAFPNVDAAPAISVKRTPDMIARGEYIANHVAVCIDCHSERDWSQFAGPIKPGTHGKGGDGGGFARSDGQELDGMGASEDSTVGVPKICLRVCS